MLVIFLLITFFLFSHSKANAQVIISEVLPKPETGSSEWVELFNTSDKDILLFNWQLWDQLSKPTMIFEFDEELIEADKYLIVELKNVLNNSGDSIILYDEQQNIIDSFTYNTTKESMSWSKNENNLEDIQETKPSPKEKNLIVSPTVIPPTPTKKPNPTKALQPTITPFPTTIQKEPKKEIKYPDSIINPKIDLPKQEFRALQSIFFEPPNLERGAISVIIGSLFLLIPGLVYAKKQELL